jgi:hypothetical protein
MREWLECALATWDLARARLELSSVAARSFTRPGNRAPLTADAPSDRCDALVRAISRAAAIVPWRADCLVQALAAKRRLEQRGVRCSIELGTRLTADGQLDAHAWVQVGGRTVLGASDAPYPLLASLR